MGKEREQKETDARMTETHVPEDQPDPRQPSRRSFLKLGVGALSVVAALEVGGAGVLFLQSRNDAGRLGGVVKAGPVDSFPPGSVTEFPGAGFYLVRSHDGGFLAVHRRCPHLGCTVDWEPAKNRFFCPCHGSSFDFYGSLESPPVPRPLDTFAVYVEDETVKVDTSLARTRERFEPGQLAYGPGSHPIGNSQTGHEETWQASGG